MAKASAEKIDPREALAVAVGTREAAKHNARRQLQELAWKGAHGEAIDGEAALALLDTAEMKHEAFLDLIELCERRAEACAAMKRIPRAQADLEKKSAALKDARAKAEEAAREWESKIDLAEKARRVAQSVVTDLNAKRAALVKTLNPADRAALQSAEGALNQAKLELAEVTQERPLERVGKELARVRWELDYSIAQRKQFSDNPQEVREAESRIAVANERIPQLEREIKRLSGLIDQDRVKALIERIAEAEEIMAQILSAADGPGASDEVLQRARKIGGAA